MQAAVLGSSAYRACFPAGEPAGLQHPPPPRGGLGASPEHRPPLICIQTFLQPWLGETEQTAEARRTTMLQPVEQKPHAQKERQNEKAEGYVPDEGTR